MTKATRDFQGLTYAWGLHFACGQRRKGEEITTTQGEIAARTGQVNQRMGVMYNDALWACIDGRLVEAVQILDRLAVFGREAGLEESASHSIAFAGLRTILYLGNGDAYPDSALWRIIPEQMNKPADRGLPTLQAHLGQTDRVNQILDRMLARRPNITTREDLGSAYLDIVYLEAATMVGHRRAVELLLQRFADNTVSFSIAFPSCIARHLGAAAAFLGRYQEARQHYQEAMVVCTEMRFRPELALTRLQLAELLLVHYPAEKKDALDHLDFAIKEFREMRMQPSLERALRHKEILKA
jgi:tetratricopeptide (TPR) repeat protein